MKLYEINEQIARIIEISVDKETGEIKEGLASALSHLQQQKEENVLNIGKYIKNLNAESEALKKEEEILKHRRQVLDNQIEGLKQYLHNNISGEKYKDAQIDITWRKLSYIDISNPSLLPEYVCKKEVIIKPDKKLIKEMIDNGGNIEGVTIKERLNLQIK